MPADDRRSGPVSRRAEDLVTWRLDELEAEARDVTKWRSSLFNELDRRYMSRDELALLFVPRKEHEANAKRHRDTTIARPMVILGTVQTIVMVVAILVAQHAG